MIRFLFTSQNGAALRIDESGTSFVFCEIF